MPRNNYNELRRKMSPERRERNEAAANEMLAEMALAELRKAAGLTQTELARVLVRPRRQGRKGPPQHS